MSLFHGIYNRRVRPRGGLRQRLRDPEPEPDVRVSKLALGLLQDWADGDLSSAQLQKHVRNAISDGMNDPLLLRLGRVGQGQNAHTGLMSVLTEVGVLGMLSPIADSSWKHCVLPSTWIRHLSLNSPRDFRLSLGADVYRTRSFWESFMENADRREWQAQHTCLRGKSVDELLHTIPLAMHEDAGPCSKKLSADCISFSSLLKAGTERLTHFLCASKIKKKSDDLKIWEVLLRDLEMLARDGIGGRGPPWKFVLMIVKADEEARCNMFGLTHWSGTSEVCPECLANRTNLPYTDLRDTAAWRRHLVTGVDEFRERNRRPQHPLLTSSFFTRHLFPMDAMHNLDCKGVTSIALGSFLMYVVTQHQFGANQGARMDFFNTELKTWYDARPGSNRLPTIRLTDITTDGWGDLHGAAIKAAMTRDSVAFFADFAQRFFSRERSCYEGLIIDLAAQLRDLYVILKGQGMFMTPASVRQLRQVCERFGSTFMQLRNQAMVDHRLAWQVTPKVHKMQHLPSMAKLLNPGEISCYMDEGSIGSTTKVWKRSLAGRHGEVNQRNVLAKRVLGVLVRLEL